MKPTANSRPKSSIGQRVAATMLVFAAILVAAPRVQAAAAGLPLLSRSRKPVDVR